MLEFVACLCFISLKTENLWVQDWWLEKAKNCLRKSETSMFFNASGILYTKNFLVINAEWWSITTILSHCVMVDWNSYLCNVHFFNLSTFYESLWLQSWFTWLIWSLLDEETSYTSKYDSYNAFHTFSMTCGWSALWNFMIWQSHDNIPVFLLKLWGLLLLI